MRLEAISHGIYARIERISGLIELGVSLDVRGLRCYPSHKLAAFFT
jgi:hypothetical protein